MLTGQERSKVNSDWWSEVIRSHLKESKLWLVEKRKVNTENSDWSREVNADWLREVKSTLLGREKYNKIDSDWLRAEKQSDVK